MPEESNILERLRRIEAKLSPSLRSEDLQATSIPRELQNVEVFVRKLQTRAGATNAGLSTYSSACTSACFSSASSLCASGSLAAASKDPELAQVFATLHRRGVEVLGEEGLMDEMVKQAKANKPINIFDIAEEK